MVQRCSRSGAIKIRSIAATGFASREALIIAVTSAVGNAVVVGQYRLWVERIVPAVRELLAEREAR